MSAQTDSGKSRRAIRVFIAEDHAIVRKGIRALLTMAPDIEVVGEASNGREVIPRVESLRPDVILMDLVMPEMDGIEAIRRITARQPEARILVLTSFATDDKVFPAIKAGALGYLLKDSDPEELVRAIRQVYRGESSLHPKIARKLLRELSEGQRPSRSGPTSARSVEPLTEREVEVLRLVAQGQSNREIGNQLTISEGTVRTHVSNILGKLHLASRTQATLYALREGLASLEDAEEVF
ncbi:MAG: response regulator transcription factor [Anaerolineae bacterium]|nr:response regulator transcription factor [Anaerolineae bacterium]